MAVTKRRTRHRAELGALLRETTEFLGAPRTHAEPHRRDVPVGLTTACRSMQARAEEGAVDTTRTPAGALVHRWCSSRHHPHICRRRGRIIEIEDPAIERWTVAIAAQHGFREAGHHVEIFGACPECAAAGPGDDR